MKAFEKAIYPIWAPLFKNETLTEVEAVHRADKAIKASGKQPDRVFFGQAERTKQAVGQKYQDVYR